MSAATLIFPHQLFLEHPSLDKKIPVWLVEEYLFFQQYRFHQQKILLHRASMKYYEESLQKQGYLVHYVDALQPESDVRKLITKLDKTGVKSIHYTDPTDTWLHNRIKHAASKASIALHCSDSPNFLNTPATLHAYFEGRKTYFQTDFYVAQRKARKLLLDKDGKPLGGKWTFDAENRAKMPKGKTPPRLDPAPAHKTILEANQYVSKNFSHHYGETTAFIYPVTHEAAEKWLDTFLEERFAEFGTYEDAMVQQENFLYHSVLTPMLNIGLLSPQLILDKALATASRKNIPLNSLEGFVRQIAGWREFIRIVYEREGSKQRTKNYWGFTRKIPASFWDGSTGIPPVDIIIKRILKTGYCHHIERLMVLGNFMLLCEFDPDEVYRWFMEMFIDSYDWVMVPNVYGMTQFADGGLMTTKPYISGSNYLMKMGDWQKGKWQEVWDGLFWRFMHVHRDFFGQNPRLGMLLNTFDRMSDEKRKAHLSHAEAFLSQLDQS